MNLPTNQNRLESEKSPYLKQHVNNPVWWRSWEEEAFAQAKDENKLIFLSVGYSTCHWCHVMEKESFEDDQVAKILNKHFVSIKVDREERPDVDAIYMEATQAMTGRGGWPMSVVMCPDGSPIFAGTYFPKDQFMRILDQIHHDWVENRQTLLDSAAKIREWLNQEKVSSGNLEFDDQILKDFEQSFAERFDAINGGYQGAPKFAPAYALRLLLRIHQRLGSQRALQMVEKTLDNISRAGIYDHLAGGFHRYATDSTWQVPHFEKMLYDQSAMVLAYLEAWQLTDKDEYRLITEETLTYVIQQMSAPNGGYFSAEDADTDGEEGKFYVWQEKELRNQLSPSDYSVLTRDFNITSSGNFEHETNILHLKPEASRKTRTKELAETLAKLRDLRFARPRPLRDEKMITEWNGLMIAAMSKAAFLFGNEKYLVSAKNAANFVLQHLRDESGNLWRRWIDGEAKHPAGLGDYAFLIDGLLNLYEASKDDRWHEEAKNLQAIQDRLFFDDEKGTYYDSQSEDSLLLKRCINMYDNVIPSGNSIAALNLLRLAKLNSQHSYRLQAMKIFRAIPSSVKKIPTAYSQMLMAIDYDLDSQSNSCSTNNCEI